MCILWNQIKETNRKYLFSKNERTNRAALTETIRFHVLLIFWEYVYERLISTTWMHCCYREDIFSRIQQEKSLSQKICDDLFEFYKCSFAALLSYSHALINLDTQIHFTEKKWIVKSLEEHKLLLIVIIFFTASNHNPSNAESPWNANKLISLVSMTKGGEQKKMKNILIFP